jgi:hypothetical protein
MTPRSQDLKDTVSACERAGDELQVLMAAVKLLVTQVERRLDGFVERRAYTREGELRGLLEEVSHLFAVALALGQIAVAGRARAAQSFELLGSAGAGAPDAAALARAAARNDALFDRAEYCLAQVGASAASNLGSLREAVLLCDAQPDVVAAVDQLFLRLRGLA